jgi:hypothetical protein
MVILKDEKNGSYSWVLIAIRPHVDMYPAVKASVYVLVYSFHKNGGVTMLIEAKSDIEAVRKTIKAVDDIQVEQ